MKRGVNAVTGNLAVGLAAGLATGRPARPRAEDDQVRRLRNQVLARLTGHPRELRSRADSEQSAQF